MSAPFLWDRDAAVRCIKAALADMGGKNCLCPDDVPSRYVIARNYASSPHPDRFKKLIELQASKDPECWEALILIEGMDLSDDFVEAYRIVQDNISNCPGPIQGHPTKLLSVRNVFIYDSIEFLQIKDIANMKLKDAIEVMADVLEESEDVIIKARQTYMRMMKRNMELQRQAGMFNSWLELFEWDKAIEYLEAECTAESSHETSIIKWRIRAIWNTSPNPKA